MARAEPAEPGTREGQAVLRRRQAVMADIDEAQELGIRGVPFFVINRKYAISGAQETDVFLDTLQKAFAEGEK